MIAQKVYKGVASVPFEVEPGEIVDLRQGERIVIITDEKPRNAGVPLQQLSPITAEMRRVLDIAARYPVLTRRQAAAFCFIFGWLDVSRLGGRRTFCDFRIQRYRTRYLHVATNRSNA